MSAKISLILIDTSIWIELLRDPAYKARTEVENLIAEDRARICAPVLAELIQGASTPKDLSATEELSEAVPSLDGNDKIWIAAGRLSQHLRSKGVTVGLLDCYLAELAMRHQAAMLSLDKHFSLIAQHSSLAMASLS